MARSHPLSQLSPEEIKQGVELIRKSHPGKTIHFKNIQVLEPPKELVIPFLQAEKQGKVGQYPPRIAQGYYYVLEDRLAHEIYMNLDKNVVESLKEFPKGAHPPIDQDESDRIEAIILKEPKVLEALASYGITGKLLDCVAADGWMYGADSHDVLPRYVTFLLYMRDPATNDVDSNVYARPIPFVIIVDVLEEKLWKIEQLATGGDGDSSSDYNTRDKSVPLLDTLNNNGEYELHLRPDIKVRDDLKPYNVIQPEGPSFQTDGNVVNWQKWQFRVGFNPREGLVLQDVSYDGRSLFYRLSVSEMTVPYADPRPPIHRKQAFDLGDIGAGFAANSLELGCDCLGTIKYFDGVLPTTSGGVELRKKVVCMHEQDDGILYKHNNYRTNNARVARRRILVLQTILTVANYEYIFAWHFDQAANIECEIRATGIVSTQYIDAGKTSRWGTVVAPSVLAAYHQHLFSMRIDPAIDGYENTVTVTDTKLDPEGADNAYGVGFYMDEKPVEQASAFDCNQASNRYVKIINENKINPITMKPVGYKLHHHPSALLMARPGYVACSRAQFATHHFWVSKYKQNEHYGGGVWTNQSSKETGGVTDMVARKDPVRNSDPVLWHSFGLTHSTRIEDWPVMPQERINIMLSPSGFFTENPAIDVPSSNQAFNRSVEVLKTRCCQRM